MSLFLVAFVAVGIGLWLVSLAVEAVRPAPEAPRALSWEPEIPIAYVDVAGVKLRYIRAGCGWFGATTIGQHSKNACASAVWFNPLQQ